VSWNTDSGKYVHLEESESDKSFRSTRILTEICYAGGRWVEVAGWGGGVTRRAGIGYWGG